ncbi:MAG: hypothetical protein OXC95_05785, partial [Dehalococcoidia bacterium]|nr:hypothetical protein [Dehalococcoidia bacterium]
QGDDYKSWAIFWGLVITGISMILHSFRFWRFGSSRLVVTNFNVPFLAISALALVRGGPGLLASLVVISTLIQFFLTVRLASLRRIFTPTVSGTVVMLVAVSAVPFIVERTVVEVQDASIERVLLPGLVALAVGIWVSLQSSQAWRLWTLPIVVASGLVISIPLGLYDFEQVIEVPWVSLPDLTWTGFDFTFGIHFWSLLPAFLFVNLTAYMKTRGYLSVIHRASRRNPVALDLRTVQGGLNLYSVSTLMTGVLGTLPFAAPWATTVVYIGFTGVASKVVGIYIGLMTIGIAPLSKLTALLIAIPSSVVSAVYVIIFGMLFVEGAKTAFAGQVDYRKGVIAGVSLIIGISAGGFAGLVDGIVGQMIGNTVVVGSVVALGAAALIELASHRRRKLEVELSASSLPAIDEFLNDFVSSHGWEEDERNRLRLVGEEVILSLLENNGNEEPDRERRRMALTALLEGSSAEVEIVVYSEEAIEENIEDQLAYMDDDLALENERQLSMRILDHYASSVSHRKYYGIDVVTVSVER